MLGDVYYRLWTSTCACESVIQRPILSAYGREDYFNVAFPVSDRMGGGT
jgi:hypothetical protein